MHSVAKTNGQEAEPDVSDTLLDTNVGQSCLSTPASSGMTGKARRLAFSQMHNLYLIATSALLTMGEEAYALSWLWVRWLRRLLGMSATDHSDPDLRRGPRRARRHR